MKKVINLKSLLVAIGILITSLTTQVWAWSFNGTNYFYLVNKSGMTHNGSSTYIQMVIGKGTSSGYTSCYNTPTVVANTQLVYKSVTVNGWSDATYMGFMQNGSNWGEGSWGKNNITSNATKYALYTSGVDASNNQIYVLTPSSNAAKTESVSLSYMGNSGYSCMNKTITIKAKVSEDGGSNYSESSAHGKLTGSSKTFSSYTTCGTSSSATLNDGSSSTTMSCGYTAQTILKAADKTGYVFKGWYDASGNQIESAKNCTIYVTEATTYYAYYMKVYSIAASSTVVWDVAGNDKSWDAVYLYKYIEGTGESNDAFTQCGSTTQYAKTYASAVNNMKVFLFRAQNGSTWTDYKQTTDIYQDVSGIALYTYDNTKTGKKLNWHLTSPGYVASNGQTVYFDNTSTEWTQPKFKYGTQWFNRYVDMVRVPGTANLWKYTMPHNIYYGKYKIADEFGWTDYNDIDNDHCGHYTVSQAASITSAKTVIPSTNGAPCTTSILDGYTRAVSITTPDNGTITVTYTDVDNSSKTKTSGSFDVAQTCIITVSASPNDGYVLNSLTVGGTAFTSGNTYTVRDATTITANFVAETTHPVTVSYKCTDTGADVKAGGTVSVGETTASTFEAGTPNGFSFTRWVVGNGLTITSGSTTSNSISVKTKSTGTYTLRAEYTEVLTTSWYISGATGGGSPFSGSGTSGTSMSKKTGYSAEEIYYCTITVNTTATGSGYSFNPYNSAESKNYGNASADITKANNSADVYGDNSTALHFKPYVTGNYEFKLDNTGAHPVLTVTWPVYNQLRVSAASPTDATNTGNFDLSDQGSNDWSVTRTLNAKTAYTFKIVYDSEWYGNGGSFTRASSSAAAIGNTGDMTITTDAAGDYIFTFNSSSHNFSITYPAAYTITFGKGANGASIGATATSAGGTLTSGDYVASGDDVTFTESANTGYRLLGWYDALEGGSAVSGMSTSDYVLENVTSNKTVYSRYTPKQCTVNFNFDESDPGYGSKTGATTSVTATYAANMPAVTPPTAANGYAFMGYWDGADGSGTQYYKADGTSKRTWNKNRTSAISLYAYYKKAEVTGITLSTAAPEPGATVNVTATISPEPVAPTIVCWEVQHENGNALSPQPTFTPASASGTSVSFVAPATSATYKVQAKLSTGSTCGAGTELDTETADFTVAGSYSVTVNYRSGDNVIKASTSISANASEWTEEFSAPDIFGYTFTQWDAVDGVTIKNGESAPVTTTSNQTIQIKAVYDGSLTASYSQKNMIYFKNTLGWSDVYVNFYTDAKWNNPKGSGNSGVTNRNKHMTHLEGTDIWYYDYGADNITPSLYVSFTDDSQDGYTYFWKASPGINVIYPANYPDAINTNKSAENGFKAATPMFVPLAGQAAVVLNSSDGGMANYYNAGYWTKYTAGTGYTLEIYNTAGNVLQKSVEFTSVDELMPMQAVVDLEANYTYKYQLRRGGESSAGIYYGNTGTMTYTDHGQDVPWDMNNSMYPFKMVGLTTTAAGDYTFNLCYAGHAVENPHYRLRMEVDYPIANGDYRVIYCDNVHTLWHPSAIVSKGNNRKDTVSFFIRPGSTPYMNIQQASVADNGAITWSTYSNVSSLLTSLPKDSVYNVCLTMNNSGAISVEAIVPYSGNYYIRTDCANSKWDNYRSDPDHLMTYSEYSITHGGYSHYYTHWVNKDDVGRKNVKFCIANDYSPCISDTLTRETATGEWANIGNYIESGGDLKRNANVRFMWDIRDNSIARAYIDGAQGDDNKFLVLLSDDSKIKDAAGTIVLTDVRFSDNQNWIYEANIKAQVGAQIKLKSTWGQTNVIEQYFKGSASETEQLIGGSTTDWYDIRLIYDFKTNRLVAGWVPASGTYNTDNPINADIMFLREHQGDIAQITFGNSGKISKIETAYGVMRFNKWTLNNKSKASGHSTLPPAEQLSIYERSLFFISFPFRVKLSEVFGFGTYMTHWAIQKYDGADRAARGNFQENGSFWKWMNRNTEYLEPNQGYLLAIDLELLKETSDIWTYGVENVELFFPSYGTMPDISKASVTQTLPAHTCTINWYDEGKVPGPDTGKPQTSYNRTIFDSHWNVMSVPVYVNTNAISFANTTWTGKVGPKFLYTWNPDDNTITATTASGFTYHAMHAYMVQYEGNLTWSASSGSPYIIARSTYEEEPKEIEFNLELLQNDKMLDRTYVVMSEDEEVSDGFKFGEDMTKEFNANKSHIYTFIPGVATVAGNTLPLSDQTTVVPVGVDVKADGEYILSVPEGTSGVGVTLVDNETGARTNLALSDYAVTLPAGTYDERFVIEISPIEPISTNVETVSGERLEVSGACKKLIDGVLYIVKDGKVFDARGARVQ